MMQMDHHHSRVRLRPGSGSTGAGAYGQGSGMPWEDVNDQSQLAELSRQENAVLLDHLAEACAEATAQAADGEQYAPTAAAQLEAQQLVLALPSWCGRPQPIVENSGAIALEWDLHGGRWLVLAVKGIGTLEYSAIFADQTQKTGVWNFTGVLGAEPIALLRRLMQLGN